MKGLIKKDILLTKSLMKSYIIIILAFSVMSITTENDSLTLMIPIFGIMACLSTLSYDNYYKWDAFALTLPINRKDSIRAKYILAMLFTIIFALVSVTINLGINIIQNTPIDVINMLTSLFGSIFAAVLTISFSLPMMYKFGSENGRIIMFIVFLIIGAVVITTTELFKGVIDQAFVFSAISFISTYLLPILIVSIIIIITISYQCSLKIYLKKEF